MTRLIKTKDVMSLVVTIIATVCIFVSISSCAIWAVKQSQVLINNPIACGLGHACFLDKNGGVKCGGYNHYGQLGDGTQNLRHKAMQVKGLKSGVKSISAGRYHTCAVTTKGALKCWGGNKYGQLGGGTTSDQLAPTEVAGLTAGVVAVASGGLHTCALTTEGKVKCWGWNKYGQLGDSTYIVRTTPVDVKGLDGDKVTQVSAGGDHTCVLTSNGVVKCWGRNSSGQLGDGSIEHRSIPIKVKNLEKDIKAIEAGGILTCALTFSGRVKCWGSDVSNKGFYNHDIEPYSGDRTTPEDESGLKRGVVTISVGFSSLCAIITGGTVKCVGHNLSTSRALKSAFYWPTQIKGIPDPVIALDVGHETTCALTNKGDFYCWGKKTVERTGRGEVKAGKVLF